MVSLYTNTRVVAVTPDDIEKFEFTYQKQFHAISEGPQGRGYMVSDETFAKITQNGALEKKEIKV